MLKLSRTLRATRVFGYAAAAIAMLLSSGSAIAQTLDTLAAVKARGSLSCGVSGRSVGFSLPDAQGVMRGIDADYCRVVAAAVFGSADKVRYVPLTAATRFTAVQTGEVDLLQQSATWTAAREGALGISFANIYFYDGGGFLVRKETGIKDRKQLDGGSFCINPGSSAEAYLLVFAKANNFKVSPVTIDDTDQLRAAFISGRCDVLMTDISNLAAFRASQGNNKEKYELLPGDPVYKSPLASVVRANDARWLNVVRWAHFALVTAEEMDITSENVDEMVKSTDPDIRRLLGVEGEVAKTLGLEPNWVRNIIKHVGNYGEIWKRNLTPLDIPRGINELQSKGGLLYAPPYR